MTTEGQKQAAKMLATKIINDKTQAEIVITRSDIGVELALHCEPEEGVIMYAMLQRAIEASFANRRKFKKAAKESRKLIDNFMKKEDL